MSVRLKLHPVLQKFAQGQEILEVSGRTTGECIRELEKRFPALGQEIRDKRGRLRPIYRVLLNSKYLQSRQLTTPVTDGDEIEIRLIPVGG